MALTDLGEEALLGRQPVSCVHHSGKNYALIYHRDQYYLLDDFCPHKAASLCDGRLRNDALECPWHKARFDLATGRGLSPLAGDGVRSYPVSVKAGRVWAELDPEPA